ncbi:uncharacterized protein F4807DRAFT_280942 [Annulohypoxylon truncatum]|uniref:uncharacterized protein n=1 Tax=Annulohypoxylon truncatum TaxID=327061 RepID=UPI0020079843|nr:uncharacterized protein F4807DRAFT_280942 [Annulohypoxylon truncatum]KAI1205524.1 hypothetical protein F4807DRAFT_280942 [Annulohypoxylon truncatum]
MRHVPTKRSRLRLSTLLIIRYGLFLTYTVSICNTAWSLMPYQLTFVACNALAIFLVGDLVPVHSETLANQFHDIILGS